VKWADPTRGEDPRVFVPGARASTGARKGPEE